MDDILACDAKYRYYLAHVISIIQLCDRYSITLNADKFSFARNKVDFCGCNITTQGYAADARKMKAIANFPRPQNLVDIRSLMGLVNQLGSFSSAIAKASQLLTDLLKPQNDWCWSTQHEEAFEKGKGCLITPPVLAYFNPTLPTMMQTDDACRRKGFGFVLLQKHNEMWKLVQCWSRFLTDTELRYAVIE